MTLQVYLGNIMRDKDMLESVWQLRRKVNFNIERDVVNDLKINGY